MEEEDGPGPYSTAFSCLIIVLRTPWCFSKASLSFLLLISVYLMHFGTTEGQHPRWLEPAAAFPCKGAMTAVKKSPEPQRLPCHAPSRTQHPGSPLVQAWACFSITPFQGLQLKWTFLIFSKAFPLQASCHICRSSAVSPPPHPSWFK